MTHHDTRKELHVVQEVACLEALEVIFTDRKDDISYKLKHRIGYILAVILTPTRLITSVYSSAYQVQPCLSSAFVNYIRHHFLGIKNNPRLRLDDMVEMLFNEGIFNLHSLGCSIPVMTWGEGGG